MTNKQEDNNIESEKDAKQASKKTSEYRNKAEKAMRKSEYYLQEIESVFQKIETEYSKIQDINNASVSIKESIVDKNNQIQEELTTFEHQKDKNSDLIIELERIFENHPDLKTELENLEENISESDTIINKINLIHKSALRKKQEIEELYFEINGYTETDENTEEEHYVSGLKDKLNNIYTELSNEITESREALEEYKSNYNANYQQLIEKKEEQYNSTNKTWNDTYKQLKEDIQNLLPNAMTAGLSYAYSDKKNEEQEDLKGLTKRFNWGIGGLIFVSLIPLALSINFIISGVKIEDVIIRLPRVVLAILPLYIPVLWLAYSASKKMNLSKRLIEEYTHKEVLSKTFEGLSKQVNSVDDIGVSNDLKIKLLYNILEISSENPGKLISDYNKSDHPFMDALEKSAKLSNAISKLNTVPGLNTITKLMENKSKKILEEQAEKIDEVLETEIEKEDE